MPNKANQALPREGVPFRYTPGNGHVYTWDGGPWIEVFDVVDTRAGRTYELSTLVIPAPTRGPDVTGYARTAEAFTRAVDQYNLDH